jgi:phage terminase large subunit-like protein
MADKVSVTETQKPWADLSQEEQYKYLLSHPYFKLQPRRSKYNRNLWWEYRDEKGQLLLTPDGKPLQNFRQLAFIQCEAPELFWGGSAGGGKTSAVAIDAVRYLDIPNYAALIMRRTWTELSEGTEAIIPFMREKLAPFMTGRYTSIRYTEKDHCFRSDEGGVIQFAHAENEKDIEKRAGTPYQRIYFEELTSFTEYQYSFMFSRQRKRSIGEVSKVPVVMRGTGNPLGVGFEFVKNRFILGKNPERWFIPSGIRDNPFIDQEDYLKRLDLLPEVLARKLRDGDWDIDFSGGVIDRAWYEILPISGVPECKFWVRAWDLAATVPSSGNPNPDYTVGIKQGYDYTGSKKIFIDAGSMRRFRKTSGDVEREIELAMEEDGANVMQVIEQQPGEAGKRESARLRQKFAGRNVKFIPTGPKSKEERVAPFTSYSFCKTNKEGLVKIYGNKNVDTILSELSMFGQKGVKDDIVDSISLGFTALTDLTRKTIVRSGTHNNILGRERATIFDRMYQHRWKLR